MVNPYICPVCGYGMEVPPYDYNICSSCGTEFEPSLDSASYADLRTAWIATGPAWWSTHNTRPKNWDPWAQLKGLDLNAIITSTQTPPAYLVFNSVMSGNNSTVPPLAVHRQPRKAPAGAMGSANANDAWVLGGARA